MRSLFYNRIYNNLKTQFGPSVQAGSGYEPTADLQWQKMANAIADIAIDIVSEIKSSAEVKVGIDVQGTSATGGPVTARTVSPGKIL